MPALAAEAKLAAATWPPAGSSDAQAGSALVGPHRSDLGVQPGGERDCRPRLASTGEQKALLISILLAHDETAARRFAASPLSSFSTRSPLISTRAARGIVRGSCCGSTARRGLPAPRRRSFAPLRRQGQFLSVTRRQRDADLAAEPENFDKGQYGEHIRTRPSWPPWRSTQQTARRASARRPAMRRSPP